MTILGVNARARACRVQRQSSLFLTEMMLGALMTASGGLVHVEMVLQLKESSFLVVLADSLCSSMECSLVLAIVG